MKIELEIPDLETICYDYYEGDEITGKDLKKVIFDIAIEKLVDLIYSECMDDLVRDTIKVEIRDIIRSGSEDIIDKTIEKVSGEILKKRAIVNEMPKKSEVTAISKEWQDYFVELVDKAIAKRFK